MQAGRAVAGAILFTLLAAAPPPPVKGDTPALVAVDAVQTGMWQITMASRVATPPRDLCVADAHALMQLRHGDAACSSFVVANEAKLATVQYSCPGAGSGRTSLRIISPTEVHIDSQGIADNAPFAFVAEARRTGDCAVPHAQPAAAASAKPSSPAAAVPAAGPR